jgi:GNAT superfamily N-acetyltransferase
VRTTSVDVIQRRGERAQLRPWRGDPATAHLAPVPGGAPLTAAFVDHCASRAALAGYRRIVSGALNPSEQGGFAQAGFTAIEELHLLSHDLVEVAAPSPAGLPLRRGRADDRTAVLAVDALAFPPFWQLDDRGIEDAVEATPAARYRVAVDGDVSIGYAITGRAGRRGYVQRLAVHPDRQRRGVGRDLVIDGLRWLRRWRVAKALVNTQVENTGAVALYTSLGFRLEPAGLSVFGRDL